MIIKFEKKRENFMEDNLRPMLNQSSDRPLYKQLKDIFKQHIISGYWKPGDKIPVQQELAEKYAVSLAVVRQAVQLLVNEGSLAKIQGKGTFVLDHRIKQGPKKLTSFTQELAKKGWIPSSKLIEATVVRNEEKIADIFGVPPSDEIVKISRLRFIDNSPLGIQTFFCPHRLIPGILEKDLTASLYQILERDYAMKIVDATEKYYATILDAEQNALLGMEYPTAGFFVKRIGKDLFDRTVEYTESFILSEKYVVEINLRR